MKKIDLNNGKFALVDDGDFAFLNQWKWRVNGHGYAVRTQNYTKEDGKQTNITVLMHRVLMGTQEGLHTDHINGDRLDNRKKNLRICTNSQNQFNKGKYITNKTGFKGVSEHKCGKWQAQIQINRKLKYLGLYSSPELAGEAYRKEAIALHGQFFNGEVK